MHGARGVHPPGARHEGPLLLPRARALEHPGPGAYRYVDFARDLEAVADATDATGAVGTSLGAGALANLLARRPDRFQRLVFLLPASLEGSIGSSPLFDRTAELARYAAT